ncbi:hypothetical protein HRE53_15595 [Acaryochloris sp. 'Moss Beach']|uniref:hypothetical protein n=1 Tax=Acaryochloris sp. 'Moss Beach' TaxID=2740837 RepID=UPI001F39A894|nr:hypothetical protein [Acaryochloris sp. 'Moss Beach']UJB68033.1 hypothetical protein HRE53_15595 [Acaryochloris sp. 'Moss Beach']
MLLRTAYRLKTEPRLNLRVGLRFTFNLIQLIMGDCPHCNCGDQQPWVLLDVAPTSMREEEGNNNV